ncbi:MAG: hypothetical protein N4A44_01640 [Alphaproteobacteria bacterium]|jgi:hypothetical protein|nr:hypothetical protein [Alphaproteobacteria bacterium]
MDWESAILDAKEKIVEKNTSFKERLAQIEKENIEEEKRNRKRIIKERKERKETKKELKKVKFLKKQERVNRVKNKDIYDIIDEFYYSKDESDTIKEMMFLLNSDRYVKLFKTCFGDYLLERISELLSNTPTSFRRTGNFEKDFSITKADFHMLNDEISEEIKEKGAPDYTSYKSDEYCPGFRQEISSAYYYLEDGVVRISDHWVGVGKNIWNLDKEYIRKLKKEDAISSNNENLFLREPVYAYAKYKDFSINTEYLKSILDRFHNFLEVNEDIYGNDINKYSWEEIWSNKDGFKPLKVNNEYFDNDLFSKSTYMYDGHKNYLFDKLFIDKQGEMIDGFNDLENAKAKLEKKTKKRERKDRRITEKQIEQWSRKFNSNSF